MLSLGACGNGDSSGTADAEAATQESASSPSNGPAATDVKALMTGTHASLETANDVGTITAVHEVTRTEPGVIGQYSGDVLNWLVYFTASVVHDRTGETYSELDCTGDPGLFEGKWTHAGLQIRNAFFDAICEVP